MITDKTDKNWIKKIKQGIFFNIPSGTYDVAISGKPFGNIIVEENTITI